MVINKEKRFIFLANKKTGSTSIENWLSEAGGKYIASDEFRHCNYRQLQVYASLNNINCNDYDVFCVVRHPFDRLKSWYKYRSRPCLSATEHYVGHYTFEQYVIQQIENKHYGLEFLNRHFVVDSHGYKRVNTFKYEQFDGIVKYFQYRTGLQTQPSKLNVSPEVDCNITEETYHLFCETFSDEIEWYNNYC